MIQQMIEKIYIRPIKQRYFLHDLGPKCYQFDPQTYTKKRKNYRNLNGKGLNKNNINSSSSPKKQNKSPTIKNIKRQDHVISTPNSQKLHLSFYQIQQPHHGSSHKMKQFKSSRYNTINNSMKSSNAENSKINKENLKQITLIYLHTHNGSRLEGLSLVQPILSLGVNLCTFDFSGYGNSSGNDVTLGVKEVFDLQKVLQFLQSQYDQVGYILWGRSMGAVTALRYLGTGLDLQDNFNIIAAIYDSPFSSLQTLTYEMVSKIVNLPQSFLTPLVMIIKSNLQQKLPFQKLQLEHLMDSIQIPGLFITSKKDTFISDEHTDRLYSRYRSIDKEIIFIERDHNEMRQYGDLVKVYEFVQQVVKMNKNKHSLIVNNLIKQCDYQNDNRCYQMLKMNHFKQQLQDKSYVSPQIYKKLSFSSFGSSFSGVEYQLLCD